MELFDSLAGQGHFMSPVLAFFALMCYNYSVILCDDQSAPRILRDVTIGGIP